MKTKNLILGICALVFAIGGAFASSSVATHVIKVVKGGPGCTSETVCINVDGSDCPSGTGSICKVQVNSSLEATVRNSSCVLIESSTNTQVATLEDPCIIDVVND